MKKFTFTSFLLLFFIPVFCQWNNNPSVNNLIANTPEFDDEPTIITDGSNGSIIIYSDNNSKIYAQKITTAGVLSWGSTSSPILVCSAANQRYDVKAISDGSGGAFICWSDYRFNADMGELFIQHINSSGTSLWTANGVRVTNSNAVDDYEGSLCSDGAGGILVGWNGDNFVSNVQLYAQRFNSAGIPQWAANGVQVCTAAGFRIGNNIISDGSNGAIFSFLDTRNDPHGTDYPYLDSMDVVNMDMYGQRVSGTGALLWTANGAPICTAAGNQEGYREITYTISDGSGGIIALFDDGRNPVPDINGNATNSDVYAQRLNSSGVAQWTLNGIPLTTAAGLQFASGIIPDGSGGFVAVWDDYTTNIPVSQRVNSAGAIQWAVNGVQVAAATDNSSYPSIVADGLGNYIYSYYVNDMGSTLVKAQKLNGSAVKQWAASGAIVCNAPTAYPGSPVLVSSDNGAVIASWLDYRNISVTGSDIYASKILSDGSLAGAAPTNYTTAANGNWNNPATWTGSVVPPAGAVVIIRHTVSVNVNASCYSVQLDAPGAVTVNAGILFTVTH